MSKVQIKVEEHIGLVGHVLNRYFISRAADFDDLFQNGCMGLIKAAKTYDEAKGTFSTYAVHCIQNEVRYALRSARKHIGVLSLDFERDNEDSTALKDTLQDYSINIEESYIQRVALHDAFGCADEVTRAVIRMRLDGYTFKEIAQSIGGTHGRASNILYRFARTVGYNPARSKRKVDETNGSKSGIERRSYVKQDSSVPKDK